MGVGGEEGADGSPLGRLLAFQLPPYYINTQWCHTLFTHSSTHTHTEGDLYMSVHVFERERTRVRE